jgi:hypothetical protein
MFWRTIVFEFYPEAKRMMENKRFVCLVGKLSGRRRERSEGGLTCRGIVVALFHITCPGDDSVDCESFTGRSKKHWTENDEFSMTLGDRQAFKIHALKKPWTDEGFKDWRNLAVGFWPEGRLIDWGWSDGLDGAENGGFREALRKAKRYASLVHKKFVRGDRLWALFFGKRRPLKKPDLNKLGDSKNLLNSRRLVTVFFWMLFVQKGSQICSDEIDLGCHFNRRWNVLAI